jgi:hypothetical protein
MPAKHKNVRQLRTTNVRIYVEKTSLEELAYMIGTPNYLRKFSNLPNNTFGAEYVANLNQQFTVQLIRPDGHIMVYTTLKFCVIVQNEIIVGYTDE